MCGWAWRTIFFNSGVLLMDLARCRQEIVPQELFDYAAAHMNTLILPDQDMLNALFGDRVLPLSDVRWNYDARGLPRLLCDLWR